MIIKEGSEGEILLELKKIVSTTVDPKRHKFTDEFYNMRGFGKLGPKITNNESRYTHIGNAYINAIAKGIALFLDLFSKLGYDVAVVIQEKNKTQNKTQNHDV